MGGRVRSHLRGNAVGYAALFVALSGSAYAAVHLPADSVGTKQLRNGAVTGKKVAKNTLTGANIKLGKLGAVPKAIDAVHATSADNATHATSSDSAMNATSSASATNALALGGLQPIAYQTKLRWALVNSDGSVIAQSGGVNVLVPDPTLPGNYLLDFGSPISPPISVTPFATVAEVGARECSEPTTSVPFLCPPGAQDADHLVVRTTNAAGSNAGESFYVVVGSG